LLAQIIDVINEHNAIVHDDSDKDHYADHCHERKRRTCGCEKQEHTEDRKYY